MTLYALDGIEPQLPESGTFWIAPDANVIGNVVVGRYVSIWFGCTLRGDNEPILLGEGSNIQEDCVIHTDPGFRFSLGRNCTVGHKAMLHGCSIGDNCLIGMGATVLNGAQIGHNSVVGACALVTENKVFPDYSLLVGSPAKVVRTLTAEQAGEFAKAAGRYRMHMERYRDHLRRIPEEAHALPNPSSGTAS